MIRYKLLVYRRWEREPDDKPVIFLPPFANTRSLSEAAWIIDHDKTVTRTEVYQLGGKRSGEMRGFCARRRDGRIVHSL